MIAKTRRIDPGTMARDCSSSAELSTSQPGRIIAMALCAMAEKQNKLPPLILPKARARALIRIVAEISKTVLYVLESGETTNCRKPSKQPSANMMGMSIRRAEKNTLTAVEAAPYMNTHNHTLWRSLALMTASSLESASSRSIISCRTSL